MAFVSLDGYEANENAISKLYDLPDGQVMTIGSELYVTFYSMGVNFMLMNCVDTDVQRHYSNPAF